MYIYIICSIEALFEILSLYIEWLLCIDIPHFQIHLTQPEVRQSSSSDSSSSSSSPALNRGAPWMMDVDFSERFKTPNRSTAMDFQSAELEQTFPKSDQTADVYAKKLQLTKGSKWVCPFQTVDFFSRLIIDDHHFRTTPIHHKNCQKMERLQVTALMKAGVPDGPGESWGCWAKATKETKEITRKPRQRPPKVRGPEFWISGSFLPLVIEMGNA